MVKKSDKLLLNILPLETAQELKETGHAKPVYYKLISVLFTDFKGFTNIAEKMNPQDVIQNLNTCFLAFDEICEKYNLEKIKTIGDAYMCAGGLPIANQTNPFDIVKAGLEMQAWMANWKAEKEKKGEQAWELRLGIHSGEAIAGVIGKNKFAYDIWGDTVNLASRMESSGEIGKVNISEATYNLVKDKFHCVYRGEIQAKNKGEVKMYFVEKPL
jgi:class 3 adenylate cyclase